MKTFVATFSAILAATAVIFTAVWAQQRIDQGQRTKEVKIEQEPAAKQIEIQPKRAEQQLNHAWTLVLSVYQRRADLIPPLVSLVAGAANLEKSTLLEVTNARVRVDRAQLQRDAPTDAAQLQEFQAAEDELSNALSRLLVVVERYPELKANQNFLSLQAQLQGAENRISIERGNFNTEVESYNSTLPAGSKLRPFFTPRSR